MDGLAALLPDRRESQELAGELEPRFLLEFASGCKLGRFALVELAFRDRPCAIVLALPIRPARMQQQHFDIRIAPTEHQDSGALRAWHVGIGIDKTKCRSRPR